MQRAVDSHKGQNGIVAVIGGSAHMHGAPILSALAAQASGVDLVYLCVPNVHAEVAKHAALNFQVHAFQGNELREEDVEPILELLSTVDVAVIGPGLGRDTKTLACMQKLIGACQCSLVLDATALQTQTLKTIEGKNVILTPHEGELERMDLTVDTLPGSWTFLLKDKEDHVRTGRKSTEIAGGNAGLTVGGTGDSLAGLTAGLWAQTKDAHEAATLASTIIKRAGDTLFPVHGYAYTAEDVIRCIPHLLHVLTD